MPTLERSLISPPFPIYKTKFKLKIKYQIITKLNTMRALLFLSSLLLLLSAIPIAHSLIGGWNPIKNVKDSHVQEIGAYAVTQHNKESGDSLAFIKVVNGATQVVSGMNYRIVLEAKDGKGKMGKYEAVVWEKAWQGFRQLTSFKSI